MNKKDVEDIISSRENITSMLINAYNNDKLSHCYLFYGNNGSGMEEMAYALALIIRCKGKIDFDSNEATSLFDGNTLNFTYLSKKDGKTGVAKEQITMLIDEFSKTSLEQGTRIFVIDGIDTVSINGQNSLLKFIEEPNNNEEIVGILIANDITNVIPTIRSRAVCVPFVQPKKMDMINNLVSSGVDKSDALLLQSLSDDKNYLLEYSKSGQFLEDKEFFKEFINLSSQKDAVLFYYKKKDMFNDKDRFKIFINFLAVFLEECLFYKDDDSLILSAFCDNIKRYKMKYNDSLSKRLIYVLDSFEKLRFNVIPKNIFHDLLIKLI